MDSQSLVATCKSFIEVFDYSQTMKEMDHEAQGAAIRDHVTRVISVGARVAQNSEVNVLKVGALCIYLINIGVNLVGPFIQYFRLWMKVSLVCDYSGSSSDQSLRGIHFRFAS